jgi:hypothetical protein
MATNQVNIINLSNLPEAQDITSGNFLIVQNDLGTQIIDWDNVPAVRQDAQGNASLTGTLTATGVIADNVAVDSLSAEYITSNGLPGVSYQNQYLNTFTFTHGIITSGGFVIGSPEYQDLVTNVIPAATAYSAGVAQAVYEVYANNLAGIPTNSLSANLTFTVLPSEINYTSFNSVDFNIGYTGTIALSTIPYISNIGSDINNNLTATLFLRQPAPSPGFNANDFTVKVTKHYTV